MIKTTVHLNDFIQAFEDFDRAGQFSYEGKMALHEYLEQLSDDMGGDIELDVIALCCEYSEHETAIECAESYFTYESIPEGTLEENEEQALEYLESNTTVIKVGDTGRIIIQNF